MKYDRNKLFYIIFTIYMKFLRAFDKIWFKDILKKLITKLFFDNY